MVLGLNLLIGFIAFKELEPLITDWRVHFKPNFFVSNNLFNIVGVHCANGAYAVLLVRLFVIADYDGLPACTFCADCTFAALALVLAVEDFFKF